MPALARGSRQAPAEMRRRRRAAGAVDRLGRRHAASSAHPARVDLFQQLLLLQGRQEVGDVVEGGQLWAHGVRCEVHHAFIML